MLSQFYLSLDTFYSLGIENTSESCDENLMSSDQNSFYSMFFIPMQCNLLGIKR